MYDVFSNATNNWLNTFAIINIKQISNKYKIIVYE